MAFRRAKGKTKSKWLAVTPSTAITAGSLVAWSSGKLIAATSTTAGDIIAGVLSRTIATTDDDYADDRLVKVEVPVEREVEWEAAVTSGLVAADIGLYQDLTDALTVDRTASTYDIVQCIKVISTTLGHFTLNIGPESLGVAGD